MRTQGTLALGMMGHLLTGYWEYLVLDVYISLGLDINLGVTA